MFTARMGRAALDQLRRDLNALGSESSRALAALIRDGFTFADLAIQVHWGDAIAADNAFWHADTSASAIHLVRQRFNL